MGWLPPPATDAPDGRRRWTVPGLDVPEERMTYVVVDEILGTSVGLTLSPWPELDDQGRLRVSAGEARTLGADRAALEQFLAEHRRPPELAARPLRVGDVFAVQTIEPALAQVEDELAAPTMMEPRLAPEEWIRPPVYDVTPDARDAAKASFYAAVTPILEPAEAALLDELVERPAPPPPPSPPDSGPPSGPRWRMRWLVASAVVFVVGIGAGFAVGGRGDGGAAGVTTTIVQRTTEVRTVTGKAGELVTTTVVQTATETQTTTETQTATETQATTETQTTTETVTTTVTVTAPPPPPPPPPVIR